MRARRSSRTTRRFAAAEAPARQSLGGRGLDAAQPLHRFVRGAQKLLIGGERVLAAAADALAELLEDEREDRRHDDRGDGEPPVEPDGGDEGSEPLGDLRERLRGERREASLEFGGVAGDARDDLGGAAAQHRAERQAERMAERLEADLGDRHHRERERAILVQEVRDRAEDRDEAESGEDQRDSREAVGRHQLDKRRRHHRGEKPALRHLGLEHGAEVRVRILGEDEPQHLARGDQSGRESARREHREDHRARSQSAAAQHALGVVPEVVVLHLGRFSQQSADSASQKPGQLLATQEGFLIDTPARASPRTENAMAMRWSLAVSITAGFS